MLRKKYSRFYCMFCHYNTERKSSYDNHLLITKHIKVVTGNNSATLETHSCNKLQNSHFYSCGICQKDFLNRSGIWKHKKSVTNNKKTKKMNKLIKKKLF